MKEFKVKSLLGDYGLYNLTFNKKFFLRNKKNVFYLIDKNVYKKNKIISKIKKNFLLIDSNENTKSYEKIYSLIKKLLKKKIKRDTIIYAIGGGVVQDVSGFVASILFRGIRWNFIPTTILAQCDSCIGGKTSINFWKFKNQLGNFYPPKKIFLDTKFLDTLNLKDIRSGIGEMAHYYLVSNKKDWNFFKKNIDDVLKKDFNKKIIKKLILKSLSIKKKFIEIDEFDTGKRLILNYGHTFGHAIEKITNYKMPHGLAVAHGINISNFISLKKKYIDLNIYKDVETEMSKIVNLKKIKKLNLNNFMETLKKDKKSKNNQIRVVLTKGYGKMFVKSFKEDLSILSILKQYVNYIK